jgi:hypothetical protein
LDPPRTIERKRLIRAGLLPRPVPAVTPEVVVVVPLGCLVPIALAALLVVGGVRR